MVWGCISLELAVLAHVKKAPSVLKCIYRFYSNICSHYLFLRESVAYFSKTMVNHILHLLQQHDLRAVQTFHQLKTIWSIIKQKYGKEGPGLESYIRRGCPQFPDIYGLLLKEEGMLHSGKQARSQVF